MNAYQEHSNKNRSRSVAEGRSVGTTHRNLQELIENSPRVKQLNAYQKMADNYSAMHAKPIQKKQTVSEAEGYVDTEERHSKDSISANTKENNTNAGKINNNNSGIIQRVAKKNKKKKHKAKKATKKTVKLDKKQVMTVRNKTDQYSSGIINHVYMATGVNDGPRKEAQKVALFLGGSWVGGHMVNDQLGGTGDFANIVPITSSMNGKHKTIENRANNELSNGHGNTVEYKMQINRRETRVNGSKTVKNLPVEFKQTLDVYPPNAAAYTVNGNVLTHP